MSQESYQLGHLRPQSFIYSLYIFFIPPVPIEIIAQPKLEQIVDQGDIVNLTVIATSDALCPPSYKWIFRNKTYLVRRKPTF